MNRRILNDEITLSNVQEYIARFDELANAYIGDDPYIII